MTQNEFKPLDLKEQLDKEYENHLNVRFQAVSATYEEFLNHVKDIITKEIEGLDERQLNIMMDFYKETYPETLFNENRM